MSDKNKNTEELLRYWQKQLNKEQPEYYKYPIVSADYRTKELRDLNYKTQKAKSETRDNLESLKYNNFWTQPYANFNGEQAVKLGSNLTKPVVVAGLTASRHEVGHVARHGDTRVGADIDESNKMQERRFNQKVIDKVLQPGKGEIDPYDFRAQHGETIMNGRDLGKDMGIETFQEYPGYEKAPEIIKNHINDYNNGKVKSSKIGMFKVLDIEDKKSMPYIQRLLNGTLLGADAISIGNQNNE